MVRAYVTENQFNDYLKHATNTEHASLITLRQQTYTFGGQGLATEKHVKHGARARYRKPIRQLPRARYKHRTRQPYYTAPQQTYTFGGQGLATEKHVTHGARTLQTSNSTIT